MAGVLVGAIAGGLIGGAIGNNIDDGDAYRHHRHYRGYRGYRSHRGHGRHHRGNGNSDEVAAGAILGAIVGGIAGGAIADDTSRPCQVATPYGSGCIILDDDDVGDSHVMVLLDWGMRSATAKARLRKENVAFVD